MFNDDLYEDVDDLTDEDLTAVAQEVEKTNTLYERIAYLGSPKMPCPECGGAGSVGGGVLGDTCPECMGARVVDHPAADEIEMPDFAGMRMALRACVDQNNQIIPGTHRLPSIAGLQAMQHKGKELAKQLAPAPATAPQLTNQQRGNVMGSLGAGDDDRLGDVSDKELEELESRADDD